MRESSPNLVGDRPAISFVPKCVDADKVRKVANAREFGPFVGQPIGKETQLGLSMGYSMALCAEYDKILSNVVTQSASKDKDYVVIEGAVHGFGRCTACEKRQGQCSNTVKNLFDYIRDWTNKRF